jgi:MFS family permease
LRPLGGALFGFDITSMSAIISTQPYLCQFNQRGFDNDGLCLGPSSTLQGLIVAIMPLGSLFGALLSGWLSDRYGRKKSVMGGSLIWSVDVASWCSWLAGRFSLTKMCRIVGSILVCASVNSAMLMVGRFVNGLSVGICSAQVPVYITEVSPPSMRGTLVSLQQWAITWGILIMYFICYGCSFINGTASFRVPWGLQMIPAACLFAGLLREPESPRWLFKKDRPDEARDVLILLHGNGNPNAPFVQRELQEIKAAVEEERKNADASWFELLAPRMINRTSIGVFTQIWSQLTGMNVMVSPDTPC